MNIEGFSIDGGMERWITENFRYPKPYPMIFAEGDSNYWGPFQFFFFFFSFFQAQYSSRVWSCLILLSFFANSALSSTCVCLSVVFGYTCWRQHGYDPFQLWQVRLWPALPVHFFWVWYTHSTGKFLAVGWKKKACPVFIWLLHVLIWRRTESLGKRKWTAIFRGNPSRIL